MRVVVYDAVGEIALDYYYANGFSFALSGAVGEGAGGRGFAGGGVFHHGRTTTHARRPYLSTACFRGRRRRVTGGYAPTAAKKKVGSISMPSEGMVFGSLFYLTAVDAAPLTSLPRPRPQSGGHLEHSFESRL